MTEDTRETKEGKRTRKIDSVHAGHRERLKQRCLEEGLDSFNDHQALELLLFYAVPYRDTNELAHRLLQYFGSFSSVLDAEYHELLSVDGVGPNTAMLLSSLPEFFRRYQQGHFGPQISMKSISEIGRYAVSLFMGEKYERFYLICLDGQHNLIKAALLSEGSLGSVSVYPRIAVETALRHHAAAVVLAHNHPGGGMQPSAGDMQVTASICEAMKTIDIAVLDHIVVAKDRYFSFYEMGLLPK